MIMTAVLEIVAYNRPGVLDRIAGLIRRNGWNIDQMSTGESESGRTRINLSLSGRGVDMALLGDHLTEMEGIHSWEEFTPENYILREMLLLRYPQGLKPRGLEGVRIIEERDGMVFAEHTGSPAQVEEIWRAARSQGIYCIRKGAMTLSRKEDPAHEG